MGQRSIVVRGTPLDRAIREVEKRYESVGRPVPICRARVNCATTFLQPQGKLMVAVGTDFGVYFSEMNEARGWVRVCFLLFWFLSFKKKKAPRSEARSNSYEFDC